MTEIDPAHMVDAIRTATRTGLPRRRLLQAAALGGAAVAGSPLLAACGTKGAANPSGSPSAAPTAPDRSDTDKSLSFSNWQLYIDVDEKDENVHPTLEQFKAKTGVTVAYTEDVNDGDSFYAKIAPALRAGQDTGRDLFALPDSDAARLIRNGYVQKLDRSRTPNVLANMIDSLKGPSWDPEREYAAPWQSGLTGIAYNSAKVPEVRSVEELFTRADLKGHVTVLTEWRDTMGLILQQLGKDASNFTDDDFTRRDRLSAEGQRLGPDPPVHRQRLLQPSHQRHGVRLHGVVRRHRAAAARQPGHQVRAARGRDDDLGRRDDDPGHGAAQEERRGPDELLLRPGGRRAADGLRAVHLPGEGRAAGDGEDRQDPRRQRADLPDGGAAGQDRAVHGARREDRARSTARSSPR